VILFAPVLAQEPGEADALRARAVSLLYLGNYEEALAATRGHRELLGFEEAYSLYRLNRSDEALRVVGGLGDSEKIQHLKAQIVSLAWLVPRVVKECIYGRTMIGSSSSRSGTTRRPRSMAS
jgi:hypothetical protein